MMDILETVQLERYGEVGILFLLLLSSWIKYQWPLRFTSRRSYHGLWIDSELFRLVINNWTQWVYRLLLILLLILFLRNCNCSHGSIKLLFYYQKSSLPWPTLFACRHVFSYFDLVLKCSIRFYLSFT